MPSQTRESYEFGPFRLDASERQLSRGSEPMPLTAKAVDVLLLLVRNADRTVTKEEFMAAVWAGTVVEEANLTDNISTLRQALGDDARDPKYIRTIPRRGYRFAAEVRGAAAENHAAAATSDHGAAATPGHGAAAAPGRRWLLAATAILALALVIAVVAAQRFRNGPQPLRSIAVFPFDPLGPETTDRTIGISLADSLITRLTNIDELIVRPARAVLPYAGTRTDLITAAREQNVDAFIEGRITKRSGRIRITVQLVSVPQARTLWARTFDEDASNLFAVEDKITEDVARELAVRLTDRDRKRLASTRTPDPKAYELYGAGRYFWSERTPQALEQSVQCFKRAIAIDPGLALAHAGLADAYSAMGIWNFKAPRESFPLAREAALAALSLDDSLAEARTALAYVKFRYDWDLAGAEKEFRNAIAAKPNYATAHVLYAEYLIVMQRYPEAEAELQKARVLDPRSPYIGMMAACRHYFMREYGEAIKEAQTVLREDPQFFIVREFLWAVYREAGDEERSVTTRLETLRPTAVDPATIEKLRAVYRQSGIRDYRRAENGFLQDTSRSQYVPAVFLAMNYAQNDEHDLAMMWLEKAYAERSGWMVELRADPVWDKIRDDRRFTALTQRVFGR
jgi:DNA-binding winged helix-turn-helix (wHTH) protein/TolB-like protein/Tfp pilus assembly protein PilF